MNENSLPELIKKHSTFIVLLISLITVIVLYPSLNKYTCLVFAGLSALYCFYILLEKFKYTRKILIFTAVLLISLFYCAITYTSFYPERAAIKNDISITGLSGWGYYNFLAYGLKNKQLSIPVEPSEKLKALKNPYNHIELNDNLSWQKYEYVMDFSFYKDKYYIYFGIVPVLTVYLPFVLVTNNFIPDSLVVLLFSLLTFYLSVLIFFKIYGKLSDKKDFLFESMSIAAIGLCSSFPFLISFPRVYEAAIISAVFFCISSFLLIYVYLNNENRKSKAFFLFLSGLCIGLACGCRPFYALAVPIQLFIIINFKTIQKNWKEYIFMQFPWLFAP